MNDRKPTYRNRVLLTHEDGTQETVTWAYADVPLVEGTPLNKATLMPDTLAEKICPGIIDPTPADGMAGLQKGAGWIYTAVFQKNGWVETEEKTGYSFRQDAAVTAVDGGPAFTADTMTDGMQVNLTGDGDSDKALLEDLAVLTQGYKEPMAGSLRIYLKEQPANISALQVYFKGRA